jgi:hypothetical protein
MLDHAFASAAHKNLSRELKALNTSHLPLEIRQHYFPSRYKEIVQYASRNRRALYKMFNADTALMDAVLKFAIIDMPTVGLEQAALKLEASFAIQLNRFSNDVDLRSRAHELLLVATNELSRVLAK